MDILIRREIETSEPVQWAIDLLEKLIDLYSEEGVEGYYWERLLQEKQRELLEDFYALTPSLSFSYHGLCYCEGLKGGRMLVMRILMDILPPYQAQSCKRIKCVWETTHQLKTFQEVIIYLKSLHLSYESDETLWKNSFFSAVKMLLQGNFSPYLLHRGGWPALIAAPPYREETAACYLYNPHVIVLYSLPEKRIAKRIYLILHEIGHLIFEKFLAGKPLPETFRSLLARMEPKDYPDLLSPSAQGIGELFANLFAMAMMYESEEGKELFHNYYSKMGKTILLLEKSFRPSSIIQTAAMP
jgi:hypothetical protein